MDFGTALNIANKKPEDIPVDFLTYFDEEGIGKDSPEDLEFLERRNWCGRQREIFLSLCTEKQAKVFDQFVEHGSAKALSSYGL